MSLVTKTFLLLLMVGLVTPSSAFALSKKTLPKAVPQTFRYAAWIPYWKKTAGVAEAQAHLSQLQEISPFNYTFKKDGSLTDLAKLIDEPWPALLGSSSEMHVAILPTVASGSAGTTFAVLSSKKLRNRHENAILDLVMANRWDGIDIDYENKTVETRPYFSAFIKELALALHKEKKLLSCTIEPRTPIDSLYYVPPTARVERANDYSILGKYCDQIRIMAYDQTTVDVRLNDAKGGKNLYAPIADINWVHKVLHNALKSFPAKKIMLGIPTYGYVYRVTPIGGRLRDYTIAKSIGYADAFALAQEKGVRPERNLAGELSFSYSTTTPLETAPTHGGLPLTGQAPTSTPVVSPPNNRYVSFTDASSIGNLVILAKSYNIRGVALFKLDGAADPSMWTKITP